MAIHGHLWTIGPWLLHKLRPPRLPPWTAWSGSVDDPSLGAIRLSGRLSLPSSGAGDACLVIVHGLGGDSDSHYMRACAAAADALGLASLRLDLRGADGSGQDLYNAALTADLRAALASPALARFETLYVLGYSLGGHLTLRHATEDDLDPRVRAVGAVCPPVDLDRSAEAIDHPDRWFYRRHVLSGLHAMYGAIAARRPLAVSAAEAKSIQRIREWDERIVAPRFGFGSAGDYYAASSVGPRLGALRVPALLVAAEHDPMVLADTVRPSLASAPARLDARWFARGGHVGFPPSLSLGLPGATGLEPQAIGWLLDRGARSRG